ncbi:MAG: ABC transporter ATP-binding protein [Alphaproteobacteria bacterium HGW-Alphaproteobacteria-2]|nr:MAG: ABC transporter ATP-binding protein [Alphaproteobacteria bacterium HGW-Alphaproteobacteria-2]
MALLDVNSVEVVYDQVSLAVKGVSFEVPEAGLVALLGANGAGKSTILKAISGLLAPERGAVSRGTISFEGEDILPLDPPSRVRRGIVHVLEGRKVFEHLTPAENLLAAATMHSDRTMVARMMDHMFTLFPRLAERAKAKAGYLSGGEQQMLAIARALMTRPKLLMMDEPSLGLAPLLVDEIFDIIVRINREEQVAVLLVEQNAVAALDVVSHAYLIEQGRIVMSGSAAELRENPDIKEAYLGGAGTRVDYHAVKHYRRRKRWLA